jgi:hypothetical protein
MARLMGMRRYRTDPPSGRAPTGLTVGAGCVVSVVSAFAAAAAPPSHGILRLGLVAAGLAGYAALAGSILAVTAVTAITFLIFNGFLVDRLGVLAWHGTADLRRLAVLAGCAALAAAAGAGYRAVRRWRLWTMRAAWIAAQPDMTRGGSVGRMDREDMRHG